MTDIALKPISSGYNLSLYNDNNDTLENAINNEMLHTIGGNNIMSQDLDMNGNALLNVMIDVNNPGSLLTVALGDNRYISKSGGVLASDLNASGWQIKNLAAPENDNDAVRKIDLDSEISGRQAAINAEAGIRASADAALQEQLNGTLPPLASALSPISWHAQNIPVSVTIPSNVNAWSFGPTMTVDLGQTVTIGSGSFWTIAEGNLV